MMVQRQHAHVDTSGLVCLPYLQAWSAAENDLVGLIQVMCATFSQAPPLRARPRVPNQLAQHSMHSATAARSPPPLQQPRESGYPPPPTSSYSSGGGISYTAAAAASAGGSPGPGQPPVLSRQDSVEDSQEVARSRQRVNAKLRSEMGALQHGLGSALDGEYELKAGLGRSTAQLDAAKASLQGYSAELLAYSTGLSEYKEALATWLVQAEGAPLTPQDAAQTVAPTDVVSAQLLATVSECAAIEDSYSLLHKMLANGVITPEQFVRETRRRAVKQFELKALAKKIYTLQNTAVQQHQQHPMHSQQQPMHPQQQPQQGGAGAGGAGYSSEFVYHHSTPDMPGQRTRPGGW